MLKLIRTVLIILVGCLPFFSCSSNNAQEIVDKAITEHGGKQFEKVKIEFDFRGRHYTSTRDGGIYTYTREFSDSSSGKIKDILTNNSFHREVNGIRATITDERAKAFSNSVNSVIYFALLPYGLNDTAVKKNYLGESTIRDQAYHTIRVTFEEEGGGEDFEDIFLFWINIENYRVDYFAYSYKSDGGGVRFREAINPRYVGGILFQDYNNFKPHSDTITLDKMKELFESDKLEKMSIINLENVRVESL